ncbi:cytochrome C biogenesis protein transmembrane region [Oxobacter pfennigii]|uniref:Cytochrome C biogenesis protein transmembrane region n=1 Tax=Oxobacter pfennigii TaxID=36849 RepID=A0A0P8WVV8_9CLOT|nr:hypothetical protein [Oxobacter pfennigii]KPU42399.1 cytochrome C biogenesis protein transmembrane region [Oxobacter pfennigii]
MLSFKQKTAFFISPLIIFLFTFIIPIGSSLAAQNEKVNITVDYFYMKPCEACKDEEDFIKHFNEILSEELEFVDVDLRLHNTFQMENSKLLNEYYTAYNVTDEAKESANILFIGDAFIPDDKDFNRRLKEEFNKAVDINRKGKGKSVTVNTGAGNQMNRDFFINIDDKFNNSTDSQIIYFYVSPCSSCEEVNAYMQNLNEEYETNVNGTKITSKVLITKLNVGQMVNLQLAQKYFEEYKVPENAQKVPIVFIGDAFLSGENNIKSQLENKIIDGYGLKTKLLNDMGEEKLLETFSGYEASGVLLTGLINGFNPCALSMMLFFISMIAIRGLNVLKLGLAYITGKFIAYFLIGTLFFNIFIKSSSIWFDSIQSIIKIILIIVALIFTILNLRDYFAAKDENYEKIKLQLPVFLRRLNHSWIKKITSIENSGILIFVCFGLGLLISVGEFLCVGQVYLATIIYIMRTSLSFNLKAVMYFIIYGIALIIPLLILTFTVHKGREVFDLSDILRQKMHIIKLVNALFFLAFSIVVLLIF